MRILIAAAFFPPYRGGYAESVRGLSAALAARGHKVTVVTCTTLPGNPEEAGHAVRIIRIPSWNPAALHGSFPIPHPFAAWRAFHAAMRGGCEVISTQTRFFPITLLAFAFGKLHGIRIVHTEHGSAHSVSHNFIISMLARLADETVGRLIFSFSDRVSGVSDAACAFARRLGAHDPACIPNGIDAGWWRRPKIPASDASPRILFVGRLVYAKGVQDLLLAVAGLSARPYAPVVSLVGDGPYRAELERLAVRLRLSPPVEFHGALPISRVRAETWRSSVSVTPSYSEGLPYSVLEAAAAGVPIIATDVGGTREITSGMSGAFLYSPGDCAALAALLDRVLQPQFPGVSRNFDADRFSWGASSVRYESLFRSVCSGA